MKEPKNLLIFGLGLSSACLILNLRQRGFTGTITVLEKRSQPEMNKRWCTWGPMPAVFQDMTTTQWTKCSVRLNTQLETINCPDSPYHELHASTFWNEFLTTAENDPNTQLHFNTAAVVPTSVTETAHLLKQWNASLCLDSIPCPIKASAYQQQFVGYQIESEKPCFDPQSVELMHFEPTTQDAIAFTYCLPYTATNALVEYTVFRSGSFQPSDLEAALQHMLQDKFGLSPTEYTVQEREQGCLPMGHFIAKRAHSGYWPIGTASGAIRASSGYGLLKIAEQAQSYAEDILQGRDSSTALPQKQLADFLDAQFLKILQRDPTLGAQALFAAASNTSSKDFVAFMRNEVTWPVAAKIIWAMPKFQFIRTLART